MIDEKEPLSDRWMYGEPDQMSWIVTIVIVVAAAAVAGFLL